MSIHNRLPEASRVLTSLRAYEIAVIERLTEGVLAPEMLQAVIRDGEFVEYDYTGYGYYLTYRHEMLPSERIVCSELGIVAGAGEVEAGFVLFLEDSELMLECYPISGEPPIPPDFRDQPVILR
jgi:hypothetical protein